MPDPRPHRLPRTQRLSGADTFRAHFEHGRRETAGPLVALALESSLPHVRIGFSTPRKLGKAHDRNRARRLVKEAFRQLGAARSTPINVVILIRPHEEKTVAEYQVLLARLFIKLNVARLPAPQTFASSDSPTKDRH